MKKIACSLLAFAVAATAFADVLLWQVPTSPVSVSSNPGGTSWDGSWEYAMLKWTDSTELNYYNAGTVDENSEGNNYVTYYRGTGGDELTGWGADKSLAGESITTAYGASGSDRRGGGWYIALYDSSNNLVGFSELLLDENVQDFRAKSHNIASWDTANAMVGGNYTAAPEPTSGVLLLLGAAVLGLRRRKVA